MKRLGTFFALVPPLTLFGPALLLIKVPTGESKFWGGVIGGVIYLGILVWPALLYKLYLVSPYAVAALVIPFWLVVAFAYLGIPIYAINGFRQYLRERPSGKGLQYRIDDDGTPRMTGRY